MAFASPEFIALCQSQVLLLTQAFEAASTVVYLADSASHSPELSLVPLVAYPETVDPWAGLAESLALLTEQLPAEEPLLGTEGQADGADQGVQDSLGIAVADLGIGQEGSPTSSHQATRRAFWSTHGDQQSASPLPPLVMPLVHEGVALGMLVTTRLSAPWSRDERQQAEQVAHTLALAWVLDQRGHWLQQQLQQRHLTQTRQSETFHDLLHQFRNPLTALQTFGRLLVKRIPADDPNQPIAQGIVRESRRLQDLAETFDSTIAQGDAVLDAPPRVPPVTGLLLPGLTELGDSMAGEALAEADQGGLTAERGEGSILGRQLTVEPGSLVEVVTPLLPSTLAIAQERGLLLIQDLPPDLPRVWMDASALGEVLSNLLDNALKYAPPGALIWITGGLVQTLDGQFFQGIAIGDTGGGIPAADQPHVFERHFRGVQTEGKIPGTGLGLAIAQELVRAMGGHLELVSPVQADRWVALPESDFSQGPGTVFIVWLPTV